MPIAMPETHYDSIESLDFSQQGITERFNFRALETFLPVLEEISTEKFSKDEQTAVAVFSKVLEHYDDLPNLEKVEFDVDLSDVLQLFQELVPEFAGQRDEGATMHEGFIDLGSVPARVTRYYSDSVNRVPYASIDITVDFTSGIGRMPLPEGYLKLMSVSFSSFLPSISEKPEKVDGACFRATFIKNGDENNLDDHMRVDLLFFPENAEPGTIKKKLLERDPNTKKISPEIFDSDILKKDSIITVENQFILEESPDKVRRAKLRYKNVGTYTVPGFNPMTVMVAKLPYDSEVVDIDT